MNADLFCRVIDNYGDIGVCWRLARRLAQGLGWRVRLWVDDLCAFARIQPGIAPAAQRQRYAGIDILLWQDIPALPLPKPGEVVIEAFACDPPAAFTAAMRAMPAPPVWINLEYLSAEDWVEGCHALPSRRADGLVKYFFFPGFTPATGGLIREPGLTAERDALQASRDAQHDFLRGLGLDSGLLERHRQGARVVALFCYPQAPSEALAQAFLDQTPGDTLLLLPEGVVPGLDAWHSGRLCVARIPFVTQPDFDRVLWCADLNFVRGEDSFVRAIWAARPLVWQIYPQDENAHLKKLQAWLARYPAPQTAKILTRAWNRAPLSGHARPPAGHALSDAPDRPVWLDPSDQAGSPDLGAALARALAEPAWQDWQAAAQAWGAEQALGPDLADKLAMFCAEKRKMR